MRTPHVSIVTPLYNNRDYLLECLTSIEAQSYSAWNCTIVDNCSNDGSGDIARQFAATHPRFTVIRNVESLPPIANHNAAMRCMLPESKYCKVVFADDWLFPECIERMVSLAEANPSVGVIGAYVLEGSRVTCTGLPYSSSVVSGLEICRRHLLDGMYLFGSANSVMYRGDLVRGRDPFFEESNIHADTDVCFALLRNSDFGFVHQVLTYTRLREGSLTSKSMDLQTSMAGWLHLLRSRACDFVSDAEYEQLLRRHVSNYYRYLGKNLLLHREAEFWSYHKQRIRDAGLPFSRVKLLAGCLATCMDVAFRPKSLIPRP